MKTMVLILAFLLPFSVSAIGKNSSGGLNAKTVSAAASDSSKKTDQQNTCTCGICDCTKNKPKP